MNHKDRKKKKGLDSTETEDDKDLKNVDWNRVDKLAQPTREEVIEHPVRKKLHDYIKLHPNVRFSEIKRSYDQIDLGIPKLAWHLMVLEKFQCIIKRDEIYSIIEF